MRIVESSSKLSCFRFSNIYLFNCTGPTKYLVYFTYVKTKLFQKTNIVRFRIKKKKKKRRDRKRKKTRYYTRGLYVYAIDAFTMFRNISTVQKNCRIVDKLCRRK